MKKIFFSLCLLVAFLISGPAIAAGNSITLTNDLIVNLSGPNLNLTVVSGSTMAGYTVGTTFVTFNLDAGSTVTLRSLDFRDLTNSIAQVTCWSTYTQTILTATVPTSVTVIPGSIACGAGGGGGGGGGGSSPAPVPPAVPSSSHPNGTLILDGKTIYLIKDGQRYGFRDPAEYKSQGYLFSQAVIATDADRALTFPPTKIVKALEGTLALDAADGKTVYMIGSSGSKRGFASGAIFKALGYSFANLLKINLTDYTVSPVITSVSDPHPEGALVLEGKTIWWIRGGTKQGFESEAVFKTYGLSFSRAVKANPADLVLPQGPLVKFRDGTLVRDAGDYYIISDGKKLKFSSSAALAVKGYNPGTVIDAGLNAYELGSGIN